MPPPGKSKAKAETRSKFKKTPANARKPAANSSTSAPVKTSGLQDIPLDLQQQVLGIFKSSFPDTFGDNLPTLLQEVKGHLYNRDFLKAFGRDDLLAAYAVRWSPSRALGYLSILYDVISTILNVKESELDITSFNFCCFGGGAGSELVSIAAVLHLLLRRAASNISSTSEQKAQEEGAPDDATHLPTANFGSPKFSVYLMDIADWTAVTQALYTSLTTAPTLSQYASATAKAANKAFVTQNSLSQALYINNALQCNAKHLQHLLREQIKLVTIFFTLNELYTTSRAQTQAFLLELTKFLSPGALLLVVDSAGSYSTVELNGAEKRYPMQWLLDHTLLKLDTTGDEGEKLGDKNGIHSPQQDHPRWEKLREEDSSWFRVPEGLKYPLELENMRYQLHLYRRLDQH